MLFFCLLGIIVAIVIDYIIAKKFEEIAEMKGHEGSTYFWFTFIFGFIGMLMVVALPNLKTTTVKVLSIPKENTEPVTTTKVQHTEPKPSVTFDANKEPPTAEELATPMEAIIDGDEKVCPRCGRRQKATRTVCWDCAQKFSN